MTGDLVLVRNFNQSSKYDPVFLEDPFVVIQRNEVSKNLILQGIKSEKVVCGIWMM